MSLAVTTLYELFHAHAARSPQAEAVIFGSTRITYAELDAEVERIARGLSARGVGKGDHVLVLAGNVPDVIAVYLAVCRLGGVYVPVSDGFKEREVSFILRNADPKLAIVAASHVVNFLNWSRERAVDVVVLGPEEAPADLPRFHELGVGQPAIDPTTVEPTDDLLLCYTSGTTSTPKPVLHSHRSEVHSATTYARIWDLGPGDRGVVSLPLAWVYGLNTTTAALLVSGATVILLDRFHPVDVLHAVQHHRATALWGTMSMYKKMLEVIKERGTVDLSSLRVVLNGGEPCPPGLVKDFEKRTGVHLQGSYATSEARPITVVRPGDRTAPDGTVGKLAPGAEIRLEGPDGAAVPTGEVGQALLRSTGMLTEYYREPELTAERLTDDGWLRSGDLMTADADGYHFVVGRQSEMIIRSGVNIAPAEIEAVLVALPQIADAAVVGIPDPRSGEALRAVVVAEHGAQPTEDEIRGSLEDQLATYKVPQEIVFADELPRTDRGKLDRVALKRWRPAKEKGLQ